jgi:hypothetical protein
MFKQRVAHYETSSNAMHSLVGRAHVVYPKGAGPRPAE